MAESIEQILFSKHSDRFSALETDVRSFSLIYGGNTIIREGIFSVALNYARKNDISLEIMRYPFHDDELWAFTFLKEGIIFLCINSELPMCKQIFASAHELYHIYCFGEDTDQNTIRNGSMIKGEDIDDAGNTMEEIEANAFAGLLLMPAEDIRRQMDSMSIDSKHIGLDDVLSLMEIFAIPYKACVLRLYESGIISLAKTKDLYGQEWKNIHARINLTGKAKRWQLNGSGTEQFGTLLEDFSFNTEQGFLTETREESDKTYISSLRKKYNLDAEES